MRAGIVVSPHLHDWRDKLKRKIHKGELHTVVSLLFIQSYSEWSAKEEHKEPDHNSSVGHLSGASTYNNEFCKSQITCRWRKEEAEGDSVAVQMSFYK